mmetsp:Transcript_12065/g.28745  ORF Transcript_12065/g.28745 Transcript_12065/m.28745 type:complete len:183 (-) Transcript_12065:61-609(-)
MAAVAGGSAGSRLTASVSVAALDELCDSLESYVQVVVSGSLTNSVHKISGMPHGSVAATTSKTSPKPPEDPLVMYVVLRKDLDWPVGALMNQVCHLSTSVAWEAKQDTEAAFYFSEVEGQMITATLGADSQATLSKLADKLQAAGVPHKVWVEQPEGVAVGLATWPRRRSAVQAHFKGVKRF